MRPQEAGFLLLGSKLGNPDRKVLTVAQLKTLGQRVRGMSVPQEDRELSESDLRQLGYSPEMARRILSLLGQTDVLEYYLSRGRKLGCVPLSRVHPAYPRRLMEKLGLEAPGCLWAMGDLTLLETPLISLVGSRELNFANRNFAAAVGRQAAAQGYTLVSGNARGADKLAQRACLAAGGSVISVVPDSLSRQVLQERVLYLSEDGFDEGFSSQRALSRNRCIHALGDKTFVAQCRLGQGGTWDGAVRNLRNGWSPVFVYADGSPGARELTGFGAIPIEVTALSDFSGLKTDAYSFF